MPSRSRRALAVEVVEHASSRRARCARPASSARPVRPVATQRDRIDPPRPAGVGAVVVYDVAGALGHEQPVGLPAALVDLGRPEAAERADQLLATARAVRPALVGQLVVAAGRRSRRRCRVGREVHGPAAASAGRPWAGAANVRRRRCRSWIAPMATCRSIHGLVEARRRRGPSIEPPPAAVGPRRRRAAPRRRCGAGADPALDHVGQAGTRAIGGSARRSSRKRSVAGPSTRARSVARWNICSADSERSTLIHWTSSWRSLRAAGVPSSRLPARTSSTRVVMSARSSAARRGAGTRRPRRGSSCAVRMPAMRWHSPMTRSRKRHRLRRATPSRWWLAT